MHEQRSIEAKKAAVRMLPTHDAARSSPRRAGAGCRLAGDLAPEQPPRPRKETQPELRKAQEGMRERERVAIQVVSSRQPESTMHEHNQRKLRKERKEGGMF